MKQIIVFFLSVSLVLVTAACGATQPAETTAAAEAPTTTQTQTAATTAATSEEQPETREMVNLEFYWQGDEKPDDQRVWDALNEITANEIQTTATHNLISWSDPTGIDLLIASGDYHDATFAGVSAYVQRVAKGAYTELTEELMLEYMPVLYAKIPSLAWAQATIGGKIYGVPNVFQEWSYYKSLAVRGDLRKKYDIPEILSVDIFEEYLQAIADNETNILPWDANSQYASYMRLLVLDQVVEWMFSSNNYLPGYGYWTKDDSGEVFNIYERQEYKDYLAKMVDWRKRGFWSANALNNDKRQQDSFLNGTSAIATENNTTVDVWVRQMYREHPEWDPEFYDGANDGNFAVIQTSYLSNTFCVSAVSKQVGRTLEWLQCIKTNQNAYDLVFYGLEGEHWIDEGPGLVSAGPKSGDYGNYSWWWINQADMSRRIVDAWPAFLDCYEDCKTRTFNNKVYYFLFEQESVAGEIAAMANVTAEYSPGLMLGMYDDWEATLETMEAAYEAAGRQKVLDEYKKQLAVHMESFVAE